MDELLDGDPIATFTRWFAEARASEPDASAVILATATVQGEPSARAVLLKGFDARGFVFFTNLESRKAAELTANPRAALCFLWPSQHHQVRAEGAVEPLSSAEADTYFASRARDSQIGAWASDQSRPVESRAVLDRRFAEFTRRFAKAEVPRPPFWSGFRVVPDRVEFWEERPARLHDRWLFVRAEDGWRRERLYP